MMLVAVRVSVLVCPCFICFFQFFSKWGGACSSLLCEVIADGLLELVESTASMSNDCIEAVIKHSYLMSRHTLQEATTVLREKLLRASARIRKAANPPAGCQCWTNWRHPHVVVRTALFNFDCSTPGIISTFLHVHPFGASIEYICSYLQRLDTKVTGLRDSKCHVSRAGLSVSQKESWILSVQSEKLFRDL